MYTCDYTQCHRYSHVRNKWSLFEVRKNQTVRAKSSEFMTCLDYDLIMKDHLHLMQLHLAWHIWCEHTIGFTVCVSEVDLNFYHEMMSWLLSLLTSLIIISSTKEQRSILNNDRFVSRWTASRPPANSCVLVSLPQRDLWRDCRSMLVSNGESVPRCRTIFSLSRQKDGRFRTTVLLNSHLAWGADVLWHGSVDACLFG